MLVIHVGDTRDGDTRDGDTRGGTFLEDHGVALIPSPCFHGPMMCLETRRIKTYATFLVSLVSLVALGSQVRHWRCPGSGPLLLARHDVAVVVERRHLPQL